MKTPSTRAATTIGVNMMLWGAFALVVLLRFGSKNGFLNEFPVGSMERFFDPVLATLLLAAAIVLIVLFQFVAPHLRLRSERSNAKHVSLLASSELASVLVNSGSFFFLYALLSSTFTPLAAAAFCLGSSWLLLKRVYLQERLAGV